jgi:4-amino-4-deoxy-L-arabinose transferase-like glycosyltransferase
MMHSERRKRSIPEILPDDRKQEETDSPFSSLWRGRRKSFVIVAALVLIALMISLRLIALDSDAYPRLSWSTALLTDEGFYMHNARNVALFGTARTDGFNNMLIMPTLHFVQVFVFRLLGVGAVQARLISVFASLVTLPVFYLALRRIFGAPIAAVGTLFLGLDHINLLYSRMALMDTPASSLLICAFYAFAHAIASRECLPGDVTVSHPKEALAKRILWTFVCGGLLGITYATRGLTALVIPAFCAALWIAIRPLPTGPRLLRTGVFIGGLAFSVAAFVVLWYLPNHTEIARVNRYYINELLVPHSLSHLKINLLIGLFDYQRGTMPYLFRHSPIQFSLALAGAGWMIFTNGGCSRRAAAMQGNGLSHATRATLWLSALWIITFWVFLSCVNYAPSRYNVLFYPPMAVLSAYTLFEATGICGEIIERKFLLAVLGSFLICLSSQAARSRLALIGPYSLNALFWGCALAFYIGSFLQQKRPSGTRHRYAEGSRPPEIWITCLAAWALVNGYWTADWLMHLTYRQRNADAWLAKNLPANSTLIGAVAPGLCMNNRFKAVNVIEDLSNDQHTLDQFAPPRYILILDEDWKEVWWTHHYPALVAPEKRIHAFPQLLRPFFVIGLYSVDNKQTVNRAEQAKNVDFMLF